MLFNQLNNDLKAKLIAELGEGENSPNYNGSFELTIDKGASENHPLVGQGSMTWVISPSLWINIALNTTGRYQ